MMQKSVPISFRLPPEVKDALEKAAKDDVRSVSSLMEKLVTQWLREHGYMKASDD
ncbi:ribbon-helix-helix protein, CopG family [Rhizobium pusense]|uniref:ribbon-helix-helix domain-containing protein n=1 Tax=Agrobacterium pusense TaxID=648995 RepID=UPI00244CD89C|nr:ribbon-helix-helix protein, CopG family [Agrobacterium pusense]MDH2092282.1 ribbon-helix-helix protein, CopG family [Agrobacterium pusense]